MICKWCGEQIDPKTRICPSCGHEVPPLSDFMGFQNATSEKPPENWNSKPLDTNMAKKHPLSKHIVVQKKKWKWAFIAILFLLEIILTVSLLSLKNGIGKSVQQANLDFGNMLSQQNEMKRDIAALQQQKPVSEPQTESIQALSEKIDELKNDSEIALETEKLSFSIMLDQNNMIKAVSSDLGKHATQVFISASIVEQQENTVQLSCDLSEQQVSFWKAEVRHDWHDLTTLSETVSISFEDEEKLGYEIAEEQWRCRLKENEDWQDISISDSDFCRLEGNRVTINLEKFLESDFGKTAELQYVCHMANSQGGSLELQIQAAVPLIEKTDENAERIDNIENGGTENEW